MIGALCEGLKQHKSDPTGYSGFPGLWEEPPICRTRLQTIGWSGALCIWALQSWAFQRSFVEKGLKSFPAVLLEEPESSSSFL